jgi:hypothetical protein
MMGEEEAACLSLEGACKLIESTKPKKITPPEEVKSAASVVFDVAGKGNRGPDLCPKGGAHEWKDDDGDTVCGKCCEPGEDSGADREEVSLEATDSGRGAGDRGAVRSDDSFASADAAFTALIRSVATCNRGFAHEKLYGDVLQSLNLAYEDFKLWRKAFRQ